MSACRDRSYCTYLEITDFQYVLVEVKCINWVKNRIEIGKMIFVSRRISDKIDMKCSEKDTNSEADTLLVSYTGES